MSLHCDMEVLFETSFCSSKKRIKRDEEDFEDLIEEIGETEELEDEEDDELMSSTLMPAEVVSILNSKEPRGGPSAPNVNRTVPKEPWTRFLF